MADVKMTMTPFHEFPGVGDYSKNPGIAARTAKAATGATSGYVDFDNLKGVSKVVEAVCLLGKEALTAAKRGSGAVATCFGNVATSMSEMRGHPFFDFVDAVEIATGLSGLFKDLKAHAKEGLKGIPSVVVKAGQTLSFGIFYVGAVSLHAAKYAGKELPKLANLMGKAGPGLLLAGFGFSAVKDGMSYRELSAKHTKLATDLKSYAPITSPKAALQELLTECESKGLFHGKTTLNDFKAALAPAAGLAAGAGAVVSDPTVEARKALLLPLLNAAIAAQGDFKAAADDLAFADAAKRFKEMHSMHDNAAYAKAGLAQLTSQMAGKKWGAIKHSAAFFGGALTMAVAQGLITGGTVIVRVLGAAAKGVNGFAAIKKFDMGQKAISDGHNALKALHSQMFVGISA